MASILEQPRLANRLGRLSRHLIVEVALGVAIFGLALGVYNATLEPSFSYVSLDGNELTTIPHELGLAHSGS